jgi:hypothetical protein
MLTQIVSDELKILTFRRPSDGVSVRWKAYLAFGLGFTWLAGIGRYWDNPRANLLQQLGLGSIAYVFCLAALLWLLVLPLRPARWSYRSVLVFVSLCSPPALLYAIPVERFMPIDAAQTTNVWFLAIVAAWRVALLVTFLKRVARLDALAVVVATLLPIVLIVVGLSVFNLEHVVFNIMSGNDPAQRTANDAAYGVVFIITIYSVLASPFILLTYFGLVYRAYRNTRLDPITPLPFPPPTHPRPDSRS